jgi:hypothetical protein
LKPTEQERAKRKQEDADRDADRQIAIIWSLIKSNRESQKTEQL